MYVSTEKRPCEETARKWPSKSQKESPHQEPTLTAPSWSWTCSLQNCEKISFSCLSHLVCGILSWQQSRLTTPYVGKEKPASDFNTATFNTFNTGAHGTILTESSQQEETTQESTSAHTINQVRCKTKVPLNMSEPGGLGPHEPFWSNHQDKPCPPKMSKAWHSLKASKGFI
jgi:hypothetical protein